MTHPSQLRGGCLSGIFYSFRITMHRDDAHPPLTPTSALALAPHSSPTPSSAPAALTRVPAALTHARRTHPRPRPCKVPTKEKVEAFKPLK
ncbi:hypothetical protein PLICRDRAFT_179707 [Plicaturopsis crispa FD-325 SS-3]|uniref:Uncharacterized protein n=1 Tax=Plicaturopsis crispa FD-325 SS-3 TaxID=944288 RepID=A0A0C9SKX1_PLICR|nr:hypothetical protein PLICRDRAFT_179707 [Plicaturopsis crispa FD-325 SS-3]